MQIALDAGGLCANQGYGNYIFSINLLRALAKLDQTNTYTAYTFCNQAPFQNKTFIYKKFFPKFGFMKVRVSFEELFHRKDILLALNQAIPLISKSKIIAFSHGVSFIHYPDLYKSDFTRLKNQLDDYLKKSHIIVTSSTKVKDDLYQYYPTLKNRVFTLLPGIPYDFESHQARKRKRYLLFVGMNHQIKNVDSIVKLFFEIKKQARFKDYLLYLVGEFEEFSSKDVRIFPKISRLKLKRLYQETSVYISMSHYESFNFPVLEALSQNCPVVARDTAVIPEMRKFVYLGKNKREVFKKIVMLNSIQHPNKIPKLVRDDAELKKIFSWEKYVSRLRTLYNEL